MAKKNGTIDNSFMEHEHKVMPTKCGDINVNAASGTAQARQEIDPEVIKPHQNASKQKNEQETELYFSTILSSWL
jgi:hypothetical protein